MSEKFKVGDRVVAVKAPDGKKELVGCVGTVRTICGGRLSVGVEFNKPGFYSHNLCGAIIKATGWWCEENSLELVSQKVIIITDGSKTCATLYEGDKMVKTAKAKRNKEDAFDFATGARLAFDRLMGEEKPAEEITLDGFKVGDRVTYEGHPGTVIVLDESHVPVGVEFDEGFDRYGHSCAMFEGLIAGAPGKSDRCGWFKSNELKHLKEEKKEEHDMKFFPVDEIKDGYLLEIEEDGKTYYAITAHNEDGKLGWCSKGNKDYCYVYRFTEALVHRSKEGLKIRKIYGRTMNKFLFDFSPNNRELLWERKDEPKKMTVAEVCKELGYDIEIVKE